MTRLQKTCARVRPCVRHAALFALLVLWLVAAAGGFYWAVQYDLKPETAKQAPATWPAGSKLELDTDRTTLLMFVHPHCPCTRASLAELARVQEQSGREVAIKLVLVKPAGMDLNWRESQVWSSIAAVPGAQIVYDPLGKEAARFRAATSGATLAYSPQGRLLFAGGVTGARGHYGPSAASEALLAAISDQHSVQITAVYGCPLTNADNKCCMCKEHERKSNQP